MIEAYHYFLDEHTLKNVTSSTKRHLKQCILSAAIYPDKAPSFVESQIHLVAKYLVDQIILMVPYAWRSHVDLPHQGSA